jgi:hypothetical protein
MNLKTLVKCLIDHYAFNECAYDLRRLEDALRQLACEANEAATEIEEREQGQKA